jgi:hypothetical protein
LNSIHYMINIWWRILFFDLKKHYPKNRILPKIHILPRKFIYYPENSYTTQKNHILPKKSYITQKNHILLKKFICYPKTSKKSKFKVENSLWLLQNCCVSTRLYGFLNAVLAGLFCVFTEYGFMPSFLEKIPREEKRISGPCFSSLDLANSNLCKFEFVLIQK